MRHNRLVFVTLSFLFAVASLANTHRTVPAEKIYLSTDRYYFNPGEMVDYAVFQTSDKSDDPISVKVKIWMENSQGKTLDSVVSNTAGGLAGGFFKLPNEGGIYYLKAIGLHQLNYEKTHPMVKEIFVQESVKANFYVDIKLDKNNYIAKSTVTSDIVATAAGNKTTEQMLITIKLLQDGSVVAQEVLNTDAEGSVSSKLTLPDFDARGESIFYITASCEYRGKIYSQTRKVPTKKRKAVISLYYSHGAEGYLLKQENEVILKAEDLYGNNLDIIGAIITAKGNTIAKLESYTEGLGSTTFSPEADVAYLFVSGADTIPLTPAPLQNGLQAREINDFLNLRALGSQRAAMQLIVSHRGKQLENTTIKASDKIEIPISTPGIYAVSLLLDGQLAARRDYFVGYDKIKRTKITLKDTITTAADFTYVDVDNTSQEIQRYSLAIVREDNIKQMEDKSHNSLTWMLLGSEYATEIERPQSYFDPKNKKAKKALQLLMNTLHPAAMRDAISGEMKAIDGMEVKNVLTVGGRVSRQNYDQQTKSLKNIKVQVKNTNLVAYTDSLGNFKMEIPAGLGETIEFVVRPTYFSSLLSQSVLLTSLQDKSATFGVKVPVKKLVQEIALPSVDLQSDETQLAYRLPIRGSALIEKDGNVASIVAAKRSVRAEYANIDAVAVRSVRKLTSLDGVSMSSIGSYYYYQPSGIVPQFNVSHYEPNYTPLYTLALNYVNSNTTHRARMQYKKQATLYWKAHHINKDRNSNRIDLSNLKPPIGGYRVVVEGIDKAGNFIYGEKYFVIKEKLDVEVNIPNQLYIGDQATIPLSITNNMGEATQAVVLVSGIQSYQDTIDLKPYETKNLSYSLGILSSAKKVKTTLSINSDRFAYSTSGESNISSYKIQEAENISGNTTQVRTVNFKNAEENTVMIGFQIFPSFNEQVTKIANALIRQPYGCFEQVSSSNYPNLAAMLLMQSTNTQDGDAYRNATQYVQDGYRRLSKYETPSGGFEWYGRNPPHQSLTAYGLLQFHLVKELGFGIDEQQYDRTIDWLWGERDGKGGFMYHPGKYGFSSAPYEVNNAYITWVMARISDKNLDKQLEKIEKDVNRKMDAYKLALLVNALYEKDKTADANHYFAKLKKHLLDKNFKELKAEKSVVHAYGAALDAEVRALALFAAMHAGDMLFAEQLKSAILSSISNRGYFGSTQATALCLEALARYGIIQTSDYATVYTVYVNGVEALNTDFSVDKKLSFDLDAKLLKYGMNTIKVETNGTSVPFNVNLKWVEKRGSVIHPELDFSVAYSKDTVQQGEYNLLKIKVQNTLNEAKGQTVASIHIPETYSISTEELRDLQRQKVVDYYELIGNTLNLYFLELGPREEKFISLNLKANYTGSYFSAAHEVVEYYHPETISKIVSAQTIVK